MSDSERLPETIETPSIFQFLPEQLKILQEHIDTVKAAETRKERLKCVIAARREIMALPQSASLALREREDLSKAVDRWFSGKAKRRRAIMKFSKKWTGRLALYASKKEEVNEMKELLFRKAESNGEAPHQAFDFFQRALTKEWKKLSRDEKRGYKRQAREWNKNGVSIEQRRE
jgi:hypothetical protein